MNFDEKKPCLRLELTPRVAAGAFWHLRNGKLLGLKLIDGERIVFKEDPPDLYIRGEITKVEREKYDVTAFVYIQNLDFIRSDHPLPDTLELLIPPGSAMIAKSGEMEILRLDSHIS